MTKIKFVKNKDNNYIALEVSGHTGYAEYGKDILCASISSIACASALGITKVLKVNADVVKKDDEGLLKIQLPKKLNQRDYDKTNIIFETALVSFKDLMTGYNKYIKLEEVCDDVY